VTDTLMGSYRMHGTFGGNFKITAKPCLLSLRSGVHGVIQVAISGGLTRTKMTRSYLYPKKFSSGCPYPFINMMTTKNFTLVGLHIPHHCDTFRQFKCSPIFVPCQIAKLNVRQSSLFIKSPN